MRVNIHINAVTDVQFPIEVTKPSPVTLGNIHGKVWRALRKDYGITEISFDDDLYHLVKNDDDIYVRPKKIGAAVLQINMGDPMDSIRNSLAKEFDEKFES